MSHRKYILVDIHVIDYVKVLIQECFCRFLSLLVDKDTHYGFMAVLNPYNYLLYKKKPTHLLPVVKSLLNQWGNNIRGIILSQMESSSHLLPFLHL